jgi:hypothetical protein
MRSRFFCRSRLKSMVTRGACNSGKTIDSAGAFLGDHKKYLQKALFLGFRVRERKKHQSHAREIREREISSFFYHAREKETETLKKEEAL